MAEVSAYDSPLFTGVAVGFPLGGAGLGLTLGGAFLAALPLALYAPAADRLEEGVKVILAVVVGDLVASLDALARL
jgi:hypothetical protein